MTLFCSDIDGTLLNPERTISKRTAAAIGAAIAAGHPFILCSSRMPASMDQLRRLFSDERQPMIAYNGGLIIGQDEEILFTQTIPAAAARGIFDLCDEIDLHASYYCTDRWYAWADDRWTDRETNNTGVTPDGRSTRQFVADGGLEQALPHKVMLMGDKSLIDRAEVALRDDDDLVTYRSKETYLEVASARCSKGTALIHLAELLGYPLSETVFFGDNHNDLSAFEVAGTSVAVANAVGAVLVAADRVTARHHDDGVAVFLEEFLSTVEVPSPPRS
jgi:Cof subfamily protein (haloacid dehalogenase superfamily)